MHMSDQDPEKFHFSRGELENDLTHTEACNSHAQPEMDANTVKRSAVTRDAPTQLRSHKPDFKFSIYSGAAWVDLRAKGKMFTHIMSAQTTAKDTAGQCLTKRREILLKSQQSMLLLSVASLYNNSSWVVSDYMQNSWIDLNHHRLSSFAPCSHKELVLFLKTVPLLNTLYCYLTWTTSSTDVITGDKKRNWTSNVSCL